MNLMFLKHIETQTNISCNKQFLDSECNEQFVGFTVMFFSFLCM